MRIRDCSSDVCSSDLRIIDRAKDVGRLNDGALFAPKYVENKLKFFPSIKEAVVFGHERDYVTAFINIDLSAVGSWAERNAIASTSYADLAGRPEVYAQIQRSEEHTSELQSLMRISYAAFFLTKTQNLIYHHLLTVNQHSAYQTHTLL